MKVEILNIAEFQENQVEQPLEFAKFTKEESAVYSIICPQHNTYTKEEILKQRDIPERIKEIVELTGERFYKFEVWEAESHEIKDPIILGREKDPKNLEYSWHDKHYLLGRWGQELESFKTLKEKAYAILRKRIEKDLRLAKMKIDGYLGNVDLFIESAFEKGNIESPSFNSGCLDR